MVDSPPTTPTTTQAGPPGEGPDRARTRKAVVAAAIGNFLEHYDFFLFAAYATVFATIIFHGPLAGLLYTFAIYGVAFVGRPLGALVFGHFEVVGVFAAVWLFVARFLEGVALGGEFAGATSYLVELAPPHRRALYGSFNTFTVGIAPLSGTVSPP